ncbi:MAG: ComEA family DNA-binding protein [Rhodothermales bacterium]
MICSTTNRIHTTRLPGLVLLLLGYGLSHPAPAQVPPDTTEADVSVEALLESHEGERGDPTQLVELLAALREDPLDLNTATAQELAQIPALGPVLARAIILFRETFGTFRSIPELRAVEGITEEAFLEARPYITIGEDLDVVAAPPSRFARPASFKQVLQDLRFDWIQRVGRRLDLGSGYDKDTATSSYAGSPDRFYTRLRLHSRRHLSLNLTLEKDPGERFAWDPSSQTYGFDHVSAHLALSNMGRLKTLVIGDFVANVGQGVVLWRSSSFGKGRQPVRPVVRSGKGIIPYGSTDENRFFRGLAATFLITPDLSVSLMASRRALDATLMEPDTTTNGFSENLGTATTLFESGLHRTLNEQRKKDAVRENLLGGVLDYQFGSAQVGIAGYRSRFNRPFQPEEQAYQRFRFAGRRASMIGAYTSVFIGNMHLFGEVGRSQDAAIGGIGGLAMRFSPVAEAVVLARHYPRDFVSLHGFAFGEQHGATRNETGYYLGLRLQPNPKWRVAAYFDQYRFPWVRFGVPRPSAGYDALFMIEHRPNRQFSVYLQGRTETKETGVKLIDERARILDALQHETRQSLRLHGAYRFSRSFRLQARIEAVRFALQGEPNELGLVFYQDVRWVPTQTVQLDVRLAVFDTDSFDSRVFTYENDLLYTFSVPSFSGRGQRAYLLARWEPIERLTLQTKISITRFEDVTTVGSGLDEVRGNRLREVKALLRWRL